MAKRKPRNPRNTTGASVHTMDPTLRSTKLELDGKTYLLVYDFDAIARAEEMTGLELLVGVDWQKINARRIRAMLYASMLRHQPKVTLDEVTDLIRVPNIPAIQDALVDTWFHSTTTPAANPQKPERTDEPLAVTG